ncbi:hypothetical protein BK126_23040 [Paenibacillus sp. FSL H7-0326]|nr:hypothetical protein BK126_23040 [Paenibacillus sp. FSL H7-0326]
MGREVTHLDSDHQILYKLMDEYGNDVWNYAYFLTRNRDHADDISQEVFIKVYQGMHTFRGDASTKTWLFTITRNTAFSYRRSRFFKQGLLGGRIASLDYPVEGSSAAKYSTSTSPSAETEVMEQQYADAIWDIIMELPDKFREVLVLSLKYDMKIKEIAELLNISEGTVKSRLSRAKLKAQKELRRLEE